MDELKRRIFEVLSSDRRIVASGANRAAISASDEDPDNYEVSDGSATVTVDRSDVDAELERIRKIGGGPGRTAETERLIKKYMAQRDQAPGFTKPQGPTPPTKPTPLGSG